MTMQLYPRKMSAKANAFVQRKIRKLYSEGKPLKQSIAIALSQARAKGYRSIPLHSIETPPKSFYKKRR